MDLARKFLECFIPLFVTIDPVGLAAIFLALGRDVPVAKRKRIANQATWTGGIVALFFLFLGRSIFIAIGIGEGDFQIAGGLILSQVLTLFTTPVIFLGFERWRADRDARRAAA